MAINNNNNNNNNNVIDVTNSADITNRRAVLLFWAPWHDDSAPGGRLHGVLGALAEAAGSTTSTVVFGRVLAEACPALTKQYHVTSVPTFILLDAAGNLFEKLEGNEDVAKITQAVQRLLSSSSASSSSLSASQTTQSADDSSKLNAEEQLTQRLDRLVRSSDVVLFIKGTPTAPKCGFSRQAVAMLQAENIPFGSFDILSDETVRQGLKKYSNWPTYPQLYVHGSLIGGLDIMKDMISEGALREQLGLAETATAAESLDDRLRKLVKRHHVMVFMKGLPSAPQCGFSRQIVQLLDAEGVAYDAFDILQDDVVRQGLKVFSNWPTYPQLYVNGSLIGGLDIVQEMQADGSLKETLLG